MGYFFARAALLDEALNHRSFVFENQEADLIENERLEFLGDAVLELAVTFLLHQRFPEADEGRLTQLRAWLVNESGVAERARELGLGQFLRLGRGEAASGGADKPSILADALEAVLGAVYLDAGFETVLRLVERLWAPLLTQAAEGLVAKDFKTQLQELMQQRRKMTPHYQVLKCLGPDHDRVFFVEVVLKDRRLGYGTGRSKKEAEQAAAEAALSVLETEKSE